MSINTTPAVPFEVIQQCQVSRTGLVSLLGDHEAMRQAVTGCLARVLLEIEQNQEDYRIFAIRDIVPGQPYSGFTNDAAATTTLYVDLDLPPRLRGLNGAVFQLNSVSNSAMTPDEYRVWLSNTAAESLPPLAEWRARASRVATLPHPRGHGRGAAGAPRPGVVPAAPAAPPRPILGVPSDPHGMTYAAPPVGGAGGGGFAMTMAPGGGNGSFASPSSSSPAQPSAPGPDIFDIPSLDLVRRQVMDEIRVKHAVFPSPSATEQLKTATLRTHERDLADYVEKIKEILSNACSPCVVCMDRECTVVTLPCKHKVLCRLCATQVTCCPVCRETTVELFEPIEQ